MNPKSNYREQLINKTLTNKKKFIVNEDSINNQNSIIIEPPKLKKDIQEKSNVNEINYHLDGLKQSINIEKENTVFICIYTIQTKKSINPYLLYLLYNDNEKFIFPYFQYDGGELSNICNEKVSSILDCPYKFKGFLKQDKHIYSFYEIENDSYIPSLIEKKDEWWFTLIYEICYLKKILYFDIEQSVVNCFTNNLFLTLLYDNNNVSHEVPIPLYKGSYKDELKYLFSFGSHKSISSKSLHGQHYYYYSYNSACRYGLWTIDFKENKPYTDNNYGRYIEGGIVRYAIFVGNIKVFINTNTEDNSSNILDKYKKISDNKGFWAHDYESVFIGDLIIDQHSHIGYRYTIKSNDQIDTLSYHYLDKSELASMYDPKKKYEII